MIKILHLTDLHLPPPGRRLFTLDPTERLAQAVAHVNAHHSDAAFALFTGDLANDGEPEAYESLKAILADLRVPAYLLLGNHDDRPLFRSFFPDAPVDEDGFLQSVVETPFGCFILLDTHEPGTPAGRLCAKRIAWLKRQLAARADQDVFIAMHHPPLDLGMPNMDVIGLIDKEAFAEAIDGHGRVRHIFFGHVHRLATGFWRGAAFSSQRGLSHQTALTLGPNSRYPGSLETPTYGVILLGQGGAVVHVCDFLDPSPPFYLDDEAAVAALDRLNLGRSQ